MSCIGHGNARVAAAIAVQAAAVEYVHNSFFTSDVAEELADLLIAKTPSMAKVYFVSDGSEAIETALKLARQYHVERDEIQRDTFISRRQSYHGNTVGALSIGGNMARRVDYLPLLMDSKHVSPCYSFHYRDVGESDEQYTDRLAQELEDQIIEMGQDRVIAFVAETVVGATAGAVPPVAGYFKKIRSVCSRYGVLLILDEIMCGTGRTGTFHAWEQESVVPDIVTMAKGLGGGYATIGAVALSAQIDATIRNGSGAFKHGHTYNSHPIACAAALEVQKIIMEEGLVERVGMQGRKLNQLLQQRFSSHDHVGDIRGRGLFQAIELNFDRHARTPFDPKLGLAAKIKAEAMKLGLCVYSNSGTIDGTSGDHVLLAPAFNVTDAELEFIANHLGSAVDHCLARVA